jgi:hypothetical protein
MAQNIARHVCAPVARRQFIFTIPKRLRIFFRFDRALLRASSRLAWRLGGVYGAELDRLA